MAKLRDDDFTHEKELQAAREQWEQDTVQVLERMCCTDLPPSTSTQGQRELGIGMVARRCA
eukprot:5539581-Amphidinium_carterae.1